MLRVLFVVLSAGFGLLQANLVWGDSLTFYTTDSVIYDGERANQGWWTKSSDPWGNHSGNVNVNVNDRYAPDQLLSGRATRNFFTFDLSGFDGTATKATLRIALQANSAVHGDGTETYALFDVSTDASTLNWNQGKSDSIWADLGSGTAYGSVDLSNGLIGGASLDIELNGAALAAINSADGYFSIGGAITTSGGYDWINFGSQFPAHLVIGDVPEFSQPAPPSVEPAPVPEPTTLLLVALGMGGGALLRRRR